jgi:hypothetical protein
MLAVLIVATIAWVGDLCFRRVHFLDLSRRCRAQAEHYADAERREVDAVAEVARVEREIAKADPPASGSGKSAWRAYREYLSSLQAKLKGARAWLDEYERCRAVRRQFERLAAKYERASRYPWLTVNPDPPDTDAFMRE